MDIKSKKLSLVQIVGFEASLPEEFILEEMCAEAYTSCQEFIGDMLDVVYSDGPVYFKFYPLSSSKSDIEIFTTFGNAINPTGKEPQLLFKENLLIDSKDFAQISAEELADYYTYLVSKYPEDEHERLAVYHVLSLSSDDELVVDVYSDLEVD